MSLMDRVREPAARRARRKPSSIRRGDMLSGAILAGGAGWASSPTEAGGYCNAPSVCPFLMFPPMRRADPRTATNRPNPDISRISPSLRWLQRGLHESMTFRRDKRAVYFLGVDVLI